MKINNVTITRANLKELVQDWERHLTYAIELIPAPTDTDTAKAILQLRALRSRMLNIVNCTQPMSK